MKPIDFGRRDALRSAFERLAEQVMQQTEERVVQKRYLRPPGTDLLADHQQVSPRREHRGPHAHVSGQVPEPRAPRSLQKRREDIRRPRLKGH